jgi:hypothetical protein
MRRPVQLLAELVMVGAVLAAVPFAAVFAVAAVVRGGLAHPEEKPTTKKARATNGQGAWAP